jgi:hypothetical protein
MFERVQDGFLWWETRIAEFFTDLGKVVEFFGGLLRCNASGKGRLSGIKFVGWWNGIGPVVCGENPHCEE